MTPVRIALSVCLLVLLFGSGSQAMPFDCLFGAADASVTCTAAMEEDVKQYGRAYCCIVAKFKYCLSSELGNSCGHQIESLADMAIKKLVLNEDSGCKDFEYISVTCLFFYYRDFILIAGLILLFAVTVVLTYKLLRCCFMCVGHCCRSPEHLKYEIQRPLGPAGEPLVVTAAPHTIRLQSAPTYRKL